MSTTSPLIKRINSDWHRCMDVIHDFPGIGTRRAEELYQHVQNLPKGSRRDSLFTHLLRAAQGGDEVSELMLLNMMLSKAFSLSRSVNALRRYSVEDRTGIAISAMWQAIKTVEPLTTSSVSGQLGLAALRILVRTDHRDQGLELSNYDEVAFTEALHDSVVEPDTGDNNLRDLNDLVTVLSWAIDTQTLTPDEVRYLARWDLGDPEDREDLLEQLGCSAETFSRRIRRIRARLVDAVQTHVKQNGAW